MDRYGPFFHGQNVELTGLPAGRYLLGQDVNPGRRIRELAYSNNAASALVDLSWPNGTRAAPRVSVLRRCDASADCSEPTD